jgi:hypothetical protein
MKGSMKMSNERKDREHDDREGTILLNMDRVIIRANEIIVEDRDNKRRRNRFDRDDVADISDRDERKDGRKDYWI